MIKFRVYFFYITTLFFFQICVASADVIEVNSTKIVCIGDSITQGGTLGRPEFSYRLPLQKLILKNGFKTDFVGVKKDGLNKKFIWPKYFDLNHEGFYGKNSAYIRDSLKTDLIKIESPDIAIVHIGTNDNDSLLWSPIIKPSVDIIRQLRAKNPNVKILIIQIPGKIKYVFTHLWVWWIKQTMSTKLSPIHTIDLYSYWKVKDHTFDGVHPNLEGQTLIARLVYSKLKLLLIR